MPVPLGESTLWGFLKSIAQLSFLVSLAVAIYAIRFRRLIWFTVRAFNREPPESMRRRGRHFRFSRVTALIAALWYLKDLFIPKGLGYWLFGDVAPGIPIDHERLQSQERLARKAAKRLLGRSKRIIIFTGGAGWGKTHTSHRLKARLAPLAQVDVSWTMISANPESRIVEEFMKVAKTTGEMRSVSLSFDHLEMLFRGNRAKTSPHYFAHIHDFEAIAIETQALASARRLIERVKVSPHVSLVITTRHSEASVDKLLPVLSRDLVQFIPLATKLPRADVRRLLRGVKSAPDTAWTASPLQLTLFRNYEKLVLRGGGQGGRQTAESVSKLDEYAMYRGLFSRLELPQQVCLQLLLARLVVSPERLFVRRPEALLAPVADGTALLRLFAYVEVGGEGGPVARLAHPTVLKLYANPEVMSPTTRAYRHAQWVGAWATEEPVNTLSRLQMVRHELRAQQGGAHREEQITSISYGETLTMCRFLFECRSDFHEYGPGTAQEDDERPSALLLQHDNAEHDETKPDPDSDRYIKIVGTLEGCSALAEMRPVRIRNLVKMMELLYQGLDAWPSANRLGDHLKGFGESGLMYGVAMDAVYQFDYAADTPGAIKRSLKARQVYKRGAHDSPFALATMLINEGIFRNNQFRNNPVRDPRQFQLAEGSYRRAGDLIDAAMDREERPAYRALMLRERLRVESGLMRWRYLSEGAVAVDVVGWWTKTWELVEKELGWPAASGIQEFAYFALNASFIELARRGRSPEWRTYYETARNYREAAGDRWFRLRLDQMAVVADTPTKDSPEWRAARLRDLASVAEEMRGMEDWSGIAFCAYQMVALRDGRVDRAAVEAQYEECVKKDPARRRLTRFVGRLAHERLFAILCGNDVAGKKHYFPAWKEKDPMPLNLHGLLLLRTVSLLDQANWTPSGV